MDDPPANFLMVAPFFPPVGGPGVQRAAKLAKYSTAYGWRPHVVTMRRPPSRNYPLDESLLSEVAQIPVSHTYRLDTRIPARVLHRLGFHSIAEKPLWLLPTDGYLGWIPWAIAKSRDLVQRNELRLVFTTGPPFSTHLVGLLAAQRFGIPWVADFRDPWTTNDQWPEYAQDSLLSKWKTRIDRRVERQCLERADRIIVVIEKHRSDIVNRFGIDPDRVVKIPNGFDEEDFRSLPFPLEPFPELFRIGYFGSFYDHSSNPRAFLRMFRRFLRSCSDPSSVRFRVVGNGCGWMRANANLFEDMKSHIELVDYVDHRRALSMLREMSVLFIHFPRPWAMTGKIFEYLRAGLPVFGVASQRETEMETLLREAGIGFIHTEQDIDGGARTLSTLFEGWTTGLWPIQPNLAAIRGYSREQLAGRFASVFDELLREQTSRS